MNTSSIKSLTSHMVAHWRNMNEEPRLGELILVELVYLDSSDLTKDENGNFYTFIPENMKMKGKTFSIGYVEKERTIKKCKNTIKNAKTFIVKDYGISSPESEKYKFPFSPLTVKRWIYIDEILNL